VGYAAAMMSPLTAQAAATNSSAAAVAGSGGHLVSSGTARVSPDPKLAAAAERIWGEVATVTWPTYAPSSQSCAVYVKNKRPQ